MSQVYQRTLPLLREETEFYWTSGKDGKLRFMRCQDCGNWIHPVLPVCPKCHSRSLAPEAVSGKGEVFSYTINAKSWGPGMEVPFIVAVVSLPEQKGLQLITKLVGVKPEEVRVGMPVEVTFVQDEDVWIPMFKAA